MKIGFGYDVHELVENRPLILGGVTIPYHKGLLGHSDADVLTHALMDSILGALALGDIGSHFPDTSNEFKDIDSMLLLKRVISLINEKGYEISNVDITLVLQKPKVAEYILNMRSEVAKGLKTDINNVSIKATTEEGLGFTGEKKGIKAYSVCLLKEIN